MYKIAIIMLHYGDKAITDKSVAAIKSKMGNNKLFLIDNSTYNVGFAKGVNLALRDALKDKSFTHFFLLNNDAQISLGTLDQLISTFLKFEHAGIVSPVLHHSHGYDWGGKYSRWTGMVKHQNWENKPKTIQDVDHVAGAGMLIKREVVEDIGLFDERFFLYFEDLDYCLRVREAGFRILINPDVIVEHQVSSSSTALAKHFHSWRSHILFIMKYIPSKTYPTALIYDSIFYPLVLLKILLRI